MKRVNKIIIIIIVIYILHLLIISACYYYIYSHKTFFYKEYFEGSKRQAPSNFKDVSSIIKRNNDLTGIIEQTNNSKLVKTYLNYNKFDSTHSIVTDSYHIYIYKFKIKEDFHLNLINERLETRWYEFIFYNAGTIGSSELIQKFGLKGNLEINSLEYSYEGNVLNLKDSLKGRLKTILIKPTYFEIGFNNDLKRMIYIKPTKEKQPLSVSFYQKEYMLFVIFLSSMKNKISEDSINEFIIFD